MVADSLLAFSILVLLCMSIGNGVEGETTPNLSSTSTTGQEVREYILPDGTMIEFGEMSNVTDRYNWEIVDLQEDQLIPGNILVGEHSSVSTLNGSQYTIIAGDYSINGYVNGEGTDARVLFPYLYQHTPQLVIMAEFHNHCLRFLNRTDNNRVTEFVGSCENSGYTDGVGADAQFQYPTRLVQHHQDPNRLYLGEQANIRIIDIDTREVSTFLQAQFSYIELLMWNPYRNNVLLILDSYSFKQLNMDTLEMTTYGSYGYLDGSLLSAQFGWLFDMEILYPDVYIVVDNPNAKLRVIDAANCEVTSICSGAADVLDGSIYECAIYKPFGVLFTNGVLYISGEKYIKALPVEITRNVTPTLAEYGCPATNSFTTDGNPTESPLAGTTSGLSAGTTRDPSAGTTRDPSAGTTTDPSAGTTRDPSVGTTRDPSGGTTRDPLAGTTRDPSVETTRDPSAGTTRDPSGGTTRDPSAGTTRDPSAGTTRDPSAGTTRDPSGGTTRDPSAGTTRDPSAGTTRDPSTGTTTDPSGGTTRDPSAGTTRGPPGGTTRDPSGGTTRNQSAGTTRDPSAGTTRDPSTGTTTDPSGGTTRDPSAGTTRDPSGSTTQKNSHGTADPNQMPSTTDSAASTLDSGFHCVIGFPTEYDTKWCSEGCFGILSNGVSSLGCLADLHPEEYGFGTVTTCSTKEQNGYCDNFVTADGTEENCIRCCTNEESCNKAYEEKCNYLPGDPSCDSSSSSAAAHVLASSLSLLMAVCVAIICY